MLVCLSYYSTKYYLGLNYNTVDGNDPEKSGKFPEKAPEKP